MKARPKYLGPAGSELAKQRLSGYLRHASLVAEQEEALDRGDQARFEALALEIGAIQDEIGLPDQNPRPHPDGARPEDESDTVDLLRATLARSERIHARLMSMKRTQAESIRKVSQRGPKARRYLVETARSGDAVAKLDVRS